MIADTARYGTETKYATGKLQNIALNGTFSGYASLFGLRDLSGDVVMPGAFRKSLGRRSASGVRMLFQHDPNEPIGVWEEIREDHKGLFVKGRLMLDVARAAEIYALMREGALNGLSIGYKTIRGESGKSAAGRKLHQVDLWEISVATFPMLQEARIESVKGDHLRGGRPTTREFERWLTRDAGLSRREARTVIQPGFKSLGGSDDAPSIEIASQNEARLATKLRRFAHQMHP